MELEAARRALAKYERILGPHPEGTDDVRHLGEQLAKSETQRTALELKLSEAEAVRTRSRAHGDVADCFNRPLTLCTRRWKASPSCGRALSRPSTVKYSS